MKRKPRDSIWAIVIHRFTCHRFAVSQHTQYVWSGQHRSYIEAWDSMLMINHMVNMSHPSILLSLRFWNSGFAVRWWDLMMWSLIETVVDVWRTGKDRAAINSFTKARRKSWIIRWRFRPFCTHGDRQWPGIKHVTQIRWHLLGSTCLEYGCVGRSMCSIPVGNNWAVVTRGQREVVELPSVGCRSALLAIAIEMKLSSATAPTKCNSWKISHQKWKNKSNLEHSGKSCRESPIMWTITRIEALVHESCTAALISMKRMVCHALHKLKTPYPWRTLHHRWKKEINGLYLRKWRINHTEELAIARFEFVLQALTFRIWKKRV
jgi:hypothetical protein